MWDGSLCEVNATEHQIDSLPGELPRAQPLNRAGSMPEEEEQCQVDKMLRPGVI